MGGMDLMNEADWSLRAGEPSELAHSAHEHASGKMPACSLTLCTAARQSRCHDLAVAHNFMTSISLRLLGDAMPLRDC